MAHPTELDARDFELIEWLVAGATPAECAARSQVSLTTVYRRTTRPAFRAAIAERRAAQFGPLANDLRELAPAVCERLRAIIADDAQTATAHVQAARTVLDNLFRASEHVDILSRVAVIEAQLAEPAPGSPATAPEPETGSPLGSDEIGPDSAPETV